MKTAFHMKAINIEDLLCPFRGAKHASLTSFASYKRHLVTSDNNIVQDNLLRGTLKYSQSIKIFSGFGILL